mgnify:CR=1 FL=1
MEFFDLTEEEYKSHWNNHPLKTFLSSPEIAKLIVGILVLVICAGISFYRSYDLSGWLYRWWWTTKRFCC